MADILRSRGSESLPTEPSETRRRFDSIAEFDRAAPDALGELRQWLYERLPDERASTWSASLLRAAPADGDFEAFAARLASRRLREEVLPLSDAWPEKLRATTVDAIEATADALETKGLWVNAIDAIADVPLYDTGAAVALSVYAASNIAKSFRDPQHQMKSAAMAAAAQVMCDTSSKDDREIMVSAIYREADRFTNELQRLT